MTIDVARLKSWPFPEVETTYTARDTMLYALCVGAGRDPVDPVGLRFSYESALQALPTMAVVLGYPSLKVLGVGHSQLHAMLLLLGCCPPHGNPSFPTSVCARLPLLRQQRL